MRNGLDSVSTTSPPILIIQQMLIKIDGFQLPLSSRRDIEGILCRQVSRFVETSMPGHAGHGERTASYSFRLGKAIRLTPAALHHLKLAALLHDIGLLTVPGNIPSKAGPLTGEEYAALQSHPRAGAELLGSIRFLREAAVLIAHHHERWDGYGYPYGLRGELIPTGSRILAVADTYDAILSRRRWLGSLAHESAWTELRAVAGSQLDPSLVTIFCDLERDHNSQTPYRATEGSCWSRIGAPG